MQTENILIPISPGELIDRITILEIKMKEITDSKKIKNISYELRLLKDVKSKSLVKSDRLDELHEELREINKSIWDSEDDVRMYWNDNAKFTEGARNSHYKNDERSRVKREINEMLGSKIIEEKSHPTYEHKS